MLEKLIFFLVLGLVVLTFQPIFADDPFTIPVFDKPFFVTVNPDTNLIYVTNAGDNTVSVIDGNSNIVIDTISVVGNAGAMTVNSKTNLIYVATNLSDNIFVINGDSHRVIETISVGNDSGVLRVNPETNMIYVPNFDDDTVSVIDGNDDYSVFTIDVGDKPYAVSVNPDTNLIYVTNAGDNAVSVIDGNINAVIETITVGEDPRGIAVNSNNNMIYVANLDANSLSVIDGNINAVIETITVGKDPIDVGVDPDNNMVYVTSYGDNTVTVIDGNINAVIETITVGEDPYGIAVNSNSNMVYVTSYSDNTVTVIDGSDDCRTHTEYGPIDMTVGNLRLTTANFGTATIEELYDNPRSSLPSKTSIGSFYELTSCDELGDRVITISYNDDEIDGLDESSLVISRYTDGEWSDLRTQINVEENTARAVTTGFSTFVLGGVSSSSTPEPEPDPEFGDAQPFEPEPIDELDGEPIEETKSSGGSCPDCTPPTFGKDKNYKMIVSDGFTYNGLSTDVTNYHTDFPLITVITNATNTVTVKVYENNGVTNIKMIQFGLGMPEIGSPLDYAQSLVEVPFHNAEIEEINIIDPDNLVDIIDATTNVVYCMDDSGFECLELTLQYVYRDQPKYNVMAINAIDNFRNTKTNYINDGILVVGESLNDPLFLTTTAGNSNAFYPQRAGSVLLTLVDYKTNMWKDEYGYMWSGDKWGPYMVDIIPVPQKSPDAVSEWSGYNDRGHSAFTTYKFLQAEYARYMMNNLYHNPIDDDAKIIVQKTYEFLSEDECYTGQILVRNNCNFDDAITLEIVKAQLVLDNMK